MSERGEEARDVPRREIEYFDSSVVLTATVVVRRAGGWSLLSAGQVTDGLLWAEFEQDPEPEGS